MLSDLTGGTSLFFICILKKIKPLRWEIEGIYAFLDNVSFLVPAPWYFIWKKSEPENLHIF